MSERVFFNSAPGQSEPFPVDHNDRRSFQGPMCAIAPSEQRPGFDQIYAEHFPFVWRTLRAFGVSGPALDDAAQDVFLVVHRRLHEFDWRASLRTWIFAITEHVAFNCRRSQRRKQAPLTSLDDSESSHAPSPFEQAQDREIAEFIEEFLQSLSNDQRIVFVLSLVEQMPAPEVAAALNIPLNTAYTRIRAIKQAFRKAADARKERMP